jgi:hypothetical protein
MHNSLVCQNPACRFVLDGRVRGRSEEELRSVVPNCPTCGQGWSSVCPFCERVLAVRFLRGMPRTACCARKLRPEELAAQRHHNITGVASGPNTERLRSERVAPWQEGAAARAETGPARSGASLQH